MAGNGGVHMDTSGTSQAMDSLGQAGSSFAGAWSGASSTIQGAAGQLGSGPLGAAFMSGYRPSADQLTRDVEAIPPAVQRAAEAGHGAVGDYTGADSRGATGFPR